MSLVAEWLIVPACSVSLAKAAIIDLLNPYLRLATDRLGPCPGFVLHPSFTLGEGCFGAQIPRSWGETGSKRPAKVTTARQGARNRAASRFIVPPAGAGVSLLLLVVTQALSVNFQHSDSV